MDKLITILTGLIVGLPGVRRKALDEVVDRLQNEYEYLKGEIDYAWEMSNKRAGEMDDANRRADGYKTRINELELELTRLGTPPKPMFTWNITVKRSVLKSHKLHSIKALREVTGLGLKEAKEWVELRAEGLADEWVFLCKGVEVREFGMAIDTLLRASANNPYSPQPTYPHDIQFHRNEVGF
jgi:ribosomal protein L7/L12